MWGYNKLFGYRRKSRPNMLPNPGFEVNLAGWSAANGATLTHNAEAYSGVASMKIVTPGVRDLEGAVTDNIAVKPGKLYTASAYVKGTPGHEIRIEISNNVDRNAIQKISLTGEWQKVSAQFTTVNETNLVMVLGTVNVTNTTFNVDECKFKQTKGLPHDDEVIDLTDFELLWEDSFEREGGSTNMLLQDGAETPGVVTVPWDEAQSSGSFARDAAGVYCAETTGGWYFKGKNVGEADCTIKTDFKFYTGDGFFVRADFDAGDFFHVTHNEIRKVVDWSPATAAENEIISLTPGETYEIKVVLSGTSIKAYVDNVLSVEWTDTMNQTATVHGLFASGESPQNRWDNIEIYTGTPVDIPGEIWTPEYAATAYGATISEDIFSVGSKSLRLELRQTDPDVSDSKRCELATNNETPQEEHWYFLDIYLPGVGDEEYLLDSAPEILTQWHNVPDDGEPWTSPPLALWTMNGKYYINRRWDEDAMTSDEKMENEEKTAWHDLGSYLGDKGKWVTWAFRVKWGWLEDQNPMLEVYKDSEKVLDCNGLPNMTNDQSGIYWKIGLYKWDWADPESESVLNTRVVYLDNVKNYLKSS